MIHDLHRGHAICLIAHSTINPANPGLHPGHHQHDLGQSPPKPNPRPFNLLIDKISLTFNDSTDLHSVFNAIQSIPTTSKDLSFILKPGRYWKADCQISIPRGNHGIDQAYFQIGSRDSKRADYRLEFNPAKLGPDGIKTVIQFLRTAGLRLDLIDSARVTRIDLALDLPGLTAEEVIVQSAGQQKVGIYTNRLGIPESVYIGSPRSNRLVAYTKPYRESGDEYLRLERRMKPSLTLGDLSDLPNPFERVRIITTDMFPKLDGVISQPLFDSIRVRGLSRAIKVLPRSQQVAIKNAVREGTELIMPSMEEIWSRWGSVLTNSGLGKFIATDRLTPTFSQSRRCNDYNETEGAQVKGYERWR